MIPRRWRSFEEEFRRLAVEEGALDDESRARRAKDVLKRSIDAYARRLYDEIREEGSRMIREGGPPILDVISIPVLLRRDVAAAVIRLNRERIATGRKMYPHSRAFSPAVAARAFTIRDRDGWVVLILVQGIP
jgi:glutathione S-transferase